MVKRGILYLVELDTVSHDSPSIITYNIYIIHLTYYVSTELANVWPHVTCDACLLRFDRGIRCGRPISHTILGLAMAGTF